MNDPIIRKYLRWIQLDMEEWFKEMESEYPWLKTKQEG